MQKFPKIKYPNDPETDGLLAGEVVVTEKLDGANFRFTWDEDGDLVVGTRNHVYEKDDENLPKAFEHAVKYLQQTIPDAAWDNEVLKQFTYFGEAMHRHSLDYEDIDWHIPHKGSPHVPLESDYPNVVLFDAYDDENERWVNWNLFTDIASDLDVGLPRVLDRGSPEDVSFDVPEESMFGGQPEGIVVRRADGTVRAKKVTEDFKEQHHGSSTSSGSYEQTDAGAFVADYVTEARIEKMAHKLVDEGEYEALRMEMMADLPRRVLVDAMSENGWDLLTSGGFEAEWDDDFKGEVRSKASKKCARVLKTMVQSFEATAKGGS